MDMLWWGVVVALLAALIVSFLCWNSTWAKMTALASFLATCVLVPVLFPSFTFAITALVSLPNIAMLLFWRILQRKNNCEGLLESLQHSNLALGVTLSEICKTLFCEIMRHGNPQLYENDLQKLCDENADNKAGGIEVLTNSTPHDKHRCQAVEKWFTQLKNLYNQNWRRMIPFPSQEDDVQHITRKTLHIMIHTVFSLMPWHGSIFVASLVNKDLPTIIRESVLEYVSLSASFLSTLPNSAGSPLTTAFGDLLKILAFEISQNFIVYAVVSWVCHTLLTIAICMICIASLLYRLRQSNPTYKSMGAIRRMVLLMLCVLLTRTPLAFRVGRSTLTVLLTISGARTIPIVVHGEGKITDSAACRDASDYLHTVGVSGIETRESRNNRHTLIRDSLLYGLKFSDHYNCLQHVESPKESLLVTLFGKAQAPNYMIEHMQQYKETKTKAIADNKCSDARNLALTSSITDADRECVEAWSGAKVNNCQRSIAGDDTDLKNHEARIRGAFLTCFMESNNLKSEWYHVYARNMIASVEWPLAKIFKNIKLTVDNENFKLLWHEVHAERVTMSLDLAARSHYGMGFIFFKYFLVLLAAAAIAWKDPSKTFAWVFPWISTCFGNVYNWFQVMVVAVVAICWWWWFGSSGTEPGTST